MKRTKARLVIVALSCLVVGIILIWIATAKDSTLNVVLATLGTVIITIGAVNLVSDFFLQQSISADLLSLIQSDRRIIEAGLDGLVRVEDADWANIATADYSLQAVILDPASFKSHIWPRLIDAAKGQLKTIELILVDPKAEELAEIARRTGQDEERYKDSVRDLRRELESEWKAMRSQGASTCSLTIRQTIHPPTHAFVKTAPITALIIDPLSRLTGHSASHVFLFRTKRRGNVYASWLTDSIRALESSFSAPTYTDENDPNDLNTGEGT